MREKIACIFPAFAMEYKSLTRNCLPGYQDEMARLLAKAGNVVDIDMRKFETPSEFVLADGFQENLQGHYVCYVDSCVVGRLLKKKLPCDYVAGYSMGLFAAMCHASAVSFEDGLRLMHHTCTLAHEATQGGEYGMGVVVGLSIDEIRALIALHCPEVEIATVCAPRVTISSGRRSDLERLLQASEASGSLRTKLLPVCAPFHSPRLKAVEGRIEGLLKGIEVRSPACGIVSCVNQKVLSSEADVREEAITNVSHPIDWLKTMQQLLGLGVDVFVECGLSDRLCHLARNIEGDYQIYHPLKFQQLFASVRPAPRGLPLDRLPVVCSDRIATFCRTQYP